LKVSGSAFRFAQFKRATAFICTDVCKRRWEIPKYEEVSKNIIQIFHLPSSCVICAVCDRDTALEIRPRVYLGFTLKLKGDERLFHQSYPSRDCYFYS
jgi:hypothetical protein